MKYKDVVSRQLEILENRLGGLITALENNKPMNTAELIRELQISKTTVGQMEEKIRLEDDDFKRFGA